MANGILKKSGKYVKLTAEGHRHNHRKNRRQRLVERVVAHFKKWQHYGRVRYLGLVKNQLELTLKAVTYNLRRLVGLAAV
jgi:IS5 family transposase